MEMVLEVTYLGQDRVSESPRVAWEDGEQGLDLGLVEPDLGRLGELWSREGQASKSRKVGGAGAH